MISMVTVTNEPNLKTALYAGHYEYVSFLFCLLMTLLGCIMLSICQKMNWEIFCQQKSAVVFYTLIFAFLDKYLIFAWCNRRYMYR